MDSTKERKYFFSVGTQLGFVYGQALELVYPYDTKGELLSELKWDMKPVFYFGIKLDLERVDPMNKHGFFSSVSFKAGFPDDSGIMEDRDWMSQENAELTHFSSHTNKTGEFYWLDAAAGYSLPLKYLYITPFLSYSWMRFAFAGRDGYGQYARQKSSSPDSYYSINDNPTVVSFAGQEVIRYEQNWMLAAAGLKLGTEFLSHFSFVFSFQISPLTFCTATDEHIGRNIVFSDYTRYGLFTEYRGSIAAGFSKVDIILEYGWRGIGNTRGESYIENDGKDIYRSSETAGAGLSFSDMRFIVRLKF